MKQLSPDQVMIQHYLNLASMAGWAAVLGVILAIAAHLLNVAWLDALIGFLVLGGMVMGVGFLALAGLIWLTRTDGQ